MKWTAMWMAMVGSVLAGCASVTSVAPVGYQAAEIDVEAWEGRWRFSGEGDEELQIEVLDPTCGVLKLTFPGGENHTKQKWTGFLRAEGDALFLSIPLEEPSRDSEYAWFRVAESDGMLVMWIPDAAKFHALVSSGVLPGRTRGDSVVLDALSPEQVVIVASEDEGVLVDWKNPVALRRVSR